MTLRHAIPGEVGRTTSYMRVVAVTRISCIAPEAWACNRLELLTSFRLRASYPKLDGRAAAPGIQDHPSTPPA